MQKRYYRRMIAVILLCLTSGSVIIAAAVAGCLLPEEATGKSNPVDSTGKSKRIYNTVRTSEPPVIDGKLNDNCWLSGEWQSDYVQFTPVYGGSPSYKTELKILYDDKSIFVAIRAYDDMEKISRKLGRRDAFSGDQVGVQFDSYFDHRTAFEFDLTSAGQKLDVWVANDGWDMNWNAVWYGKVAQEDSAWTAEFQIPLSQLRYSSSGDQVWGFNSWRYIDRMHEEDHWNLVANDGTGIVYTYGELHGLEGLTKARRIELTPYVSGSLATSRQEPGNPFATGRDFGGRAGLDAKIGITNNFTLDATINPDFGQVEADPSVMNLTAFETYFEEKRPFFVEGKNIFDYSFDEDQLFYTRRIGHAPSYKPPFDTVSIPEYTNIGAAFKLSGKTSKGLSLGIIESVELKATAEIHENNVDSQMDVEPLTNYLIGRFQQDFDRGNTIIGGIVTHTHRSVKSDNLEFLSRNALTYGLEFTRYWKDRKYFLEAKAIGSNINGDAEAINRLQTSSTRYYQRPDISGVVYDTTLTALNGWGASLNAGKWSKGHWRYNEELIMRSPGLELNDLGYMTLSNLLKNNTQISYVEKENTRIFKNYTFSLLQQNAWNANGQGLYSLVSLSAESELMNNWGLSVSSQYKFRTLDERLLRGGPSMKVPDIVTWSWSLNTDYARNLYLIFYGNYSKGLAGNLKNVMLSSTLTYRPWNNLALSVQPTFQKNLDELQFIGRFDSSTQDNTWLLATVDNRNAGITFRIDFAITPELTIQYYGSPFVSIGKYTDFKEVTNPLDDSYENRFSIVVPEENGLMYDFESDNNGTVDYSIFNPDFNYQQFRSNLVLRWEYKAGSALYLVWAQDRTAYEPAGEFDINTGVRNMFDIFPGNIFMIKFSYWFSLR